MTVLFERYDSIYRNSIDLEQIAELISMHRRRSITAADLLTEDYKRILSGKVIFAKDACGNIVGLMIYEVLVIDGDTSIKIKCICSKLDENLQDAIDLFYLIAEAICDDLSNASYVSIEDELDNLNEIKVLTSMGYKRTAKGYIKTLNIEKAIG